MPEEITIRRAESRDIPVLMAFNVAMARETENKQLDPQVVARGVRRLLDNPRAGFYMVAECRDRLIGALMVTFEWSDWRDGFFWWLQSVYVDPAHRRNGTFRRLFEELRREARAHSEVCGLRLYVEHTNEVAQATYQAMGMVKTPYQVFEVEFEH